MFIRKGIDVSKWQGKIDWLRVKKVGVDFAMVRLGYGSANGDKCRTDSYYAANMDGARRAGVHTGVYFYSYALSAVAAAREAEFVLKELAPFQKQLSYPVAYDVEDESQKELDRDVLTEMVNVFCSAVEKAGYVGAFYCGLDWCRNRLNMDALQDYDLWLAQWGEEASREFGHSIWQYTDSGTVDGISGKVDLNVTHKDYVGMKEFKQKHEK